MCDSHYKVKKLMSAFGLPYEKIDACVKGCMLYWKDDVDLRKCKICNEERYKPRKKKGKEVPCKRMHYLSITPRLQRFMHLLLLHVICDGTVWEHQKKEL